MICLWILRAFLWLVKTVFYFGIITEYTSLLRRLLHRDTEREKKNSKENACTKHIRDLFVNDTCIFVISKNGILFWYNDWVYQSSTEIFASRHGEREKRIQEENACTIYVICLWILRAFLWLVKMNFYFGIMTEYTSLLRMVTEWIFWNWISFAYKIYWAYVFLLYYNL